MREYFVEFVGTTLFILTFIGAVVADHPATPLAIGGALMVMVYAGGHISGGHYNPAVSLAVMLRGRLATAELLPYWAAQLLGALVAGALGIWLFDSDSAVPLNVGDNDLLLEALVTEFLLTFALVWVTLNTTTSRHHSDNGFYGLAVGFTMLVGVVSVGDISGAALNPAVAFGLNVSGLFDWPTIWVYLLAGLAGGTLAAYAFKFANPDDP
ncbi:MAG: porin [Propionibacteriales bacterium]|nr:porin [Propionibacteriales bacterium]